MPEFPEYSVASKNLSLRAKVGQLFMPAAFIHDTEERIQALEALIRTHCIGGLCFFHSPESVATNFEGKRKVQYHPDSLQRLKQLISRYQKAATYPLLTAMDAEWGLAMRVEQAPRYPYALTLGALPADCDPLLHEVGLRMAADCVDAGINWTLCPVVDINTNPENPVIGYRAFGNRPHDVARKSLTLFKGLGDGGILSCAKHFPGHGDTAVDSHLDLPVLRKSIPELEAEEFIPFRHLIQAGAPAIMTGHLSVPSLDPSGLPASLSEKMIGYLRETLGFKGVIITDALNMQALGSIENRPERINLRALQAGNDILCFASGIPESIELALGSISEHQLEASFQRVWNLKQGVFDRSEGRTEPSHTPESLNRKLAPHCLCEIGSNQAVTSSWQTRDTCLLYYEIRPNAFMDKVLESLNLEERKWEAGQEVSKIQFTEHSKVVLALQPPSMKPSENFGLSNAFFTELGLLAREREVLLYLFGNPYLLNSCPRDLFRGIVCAFEPMVAMQEAAAMQFLGKREATGILPIQLNDAYEE